jgi:hypothetical protein
MLYRISYTHDGEVLVRLFKSPKSLMVLSRMVHQAGMIVLEQPLTDENGKPVPDAAIYIPHIISIEAVPDLATPPAFSREINPPSHADAGYSL